MSELRRAKIVCTLGPASNTEARIKKMVHKGMDVVRLNFSHGTHKEHAALIEMVRKVSRESERPMSLIADLQGPKIRTGVLANGSTVCLKGGQDFVLTTRQCQGDEKGISTDYKHLHEDLHKGDRVLINDGLIELRVLGVRGRDIRCRVLNGGELSAHKGINLPGVQLRIASIDAKDRRDLAFALEHGADYIAVSFVRSAKDVLAVKKLIKKQGFKTQVIAKMEKAEALANLDEILEASDGVMVARGDLGVEMSPEKVPPAQKRIILRARDFRRPVITATQMLDSMTRNPRPTRAEASDVANAVYDGTSALMLSNETASGRYPLESVDMMDRIIREAESVRQPRLRYPMRIRSIDIAESICQGVVEAARQLPVRCIAVFTETGRTARLVSHFRPRCPIVAFSTNQKTRRSLALLWGVQPRKIQRLNDIDALAKVAEWRLVEEGFAKKGDIVGVVAGVPLSVAGSTNMVKLHTVGQH